MKNSHFTTLFVVIAAITAVSCRDAKPAASELGDGIDSVKVEVATKTYHRCIVLTNDRQAIVSRDGSLGDTLSVEETQSLKSLATKLFIDKTERIVLSEEKASGRTSHPVFTVTLYRVGKGESTRYDMGDEADGITRCTTRNIRYSDAFRDFMFSVFEIFDR